MGAEDRESQVIQGHFDKEHESIVTAQIEVLSQQLGHGDDQLLSGCGETAVQERQILASLW